MIHEHGFPLTALGLPFVALRRRRKLSAARRRADLELARWPYVPLQLMWRANELVGDKNRRELARSVRSAIRDSNPRYLPGASPLNRGAVRAEAGTLEEIASRLAAVEHEVSPRGVALVERLLTDGSSPLYDGGDSDSLGDKLDQILESLGERRS